MPKIISAKIDNFVENTFRVSRIIITGRLISLKTDYDKNKLNKMKKKLSNIL